MPRVKGQAETLMGTSVPIQAQVALDQTGRMLLGTDVGAVVTILEGMGVDVIGTNCSVGPEHLREPVSYMCSHSTKPVSVVPNAGLPRNVGGVAHYDLGPDEMAKQIAAMVRDFGPNVVGGCCGSTPDHIRAIVAALKDVTPHAHPPVARTPRVASAMRTVDLGQEPRPTIVGVRVNTQGSRMIKGIRFEGLSHHASLDKILALMDYDALVADREFSSWVERRTPLGRWGDPKELGGAAVYLMSAGASFVNGHVLSVDGGFGVAV